MRQRLVSRSPVHPVPVLGCSILTTTARLIPQNLPVDHIDMRTLLEILLSAALVGLTWQQSLQSRIDSLIGTNARPTPPAVFVAPANGYVAHAAATPSGQWMWDPARRSALDRPAYDSKDKSQRYLDAEGRKFWLDGNGGRHYDP